MSQTENTQTENTETENTQPETTQPRSAINDPNAIFQPDGPIHPSFMREAIRTLIRSLPLDEKQEPESWSHRRMHSALMALAALRPRDEIEVMLGVQTLSAYHAAAASWRLGMNTQHPRGNNARHFSVAATAARTFDTLLKALERRQAKPLPPESERPTPREWLKAHPSRAILQWQTSVSTDDEDTPEADDTVEWTPEAVALAHELAEQARIEEENRGLDIANTEGIRPDGSIIMPEDPTPNQAAYIARRLWIRHKKEWADNRRRGINKEPDIRPLRTGDIVP
jgi:hypothetical protein